MTPTLEARLAEVMECQCGARASHGYEDLHEDECDARLYPAILALIRTLLREERKKVLDEIAQR